MFGYFPWTLSVPRSPPLTIQSLYESFENIGIDSSSLKNGLNHIFVTETKNAAQMAIYQTLPQFLVASHKVAILVHSYF